MSYDVRIGTTNTLISEVLPSPGSLERPVSSFQKLDLHLWSWYANAECAIKETGRIPMNTY